MLNYLSILVYDELPLYIFLLLNAAKMPEKQSPSIQVSLPQTITFLCPLRMQSLKISNMANSRSCLF